MTNLRGRGPPTPLDECGIRRGPCRLDVGSSKNDIKSL